MKRHVLAIRFGTVLLALCVGLPACGGGESERKRIDVSALLTGTRDPGPSERFAEENEELEVEAHDLDGDNVADLWTVERVEKENIDDLDETTKLVRKEVDSNFDERVDLWFFYNSRELLFRQESDNDFDGSIDLIEYYEEGRIVKREVFRDAVTPASIKHYRDGRLVRIEIDGDGDGAIDTWEIYLAGALMQIGYDTDGDTRVDMWEEMQ